MKKFIKKMIKKTEGFTLVELIVVIAILGILAAVAVPAYSGYLEKANKAADETVLANIDTAAASAAALYGHTTDDIDVQIAISDGEGTVTLTSSVDEASSIQTAFAEFLGEDSYSATAIKVDLKYATAVDYVDGKLDITTPAN